MPKLKTWRPPKTLVEALEEIARERALGDRLMVYTQHEDDCSTRDGGRPAEPHPCSCGLRGVMRQWAATRAVSEPEGDEEKPWTGTI